MYDALLYGKGSVTGVSIKFSWNDQIQVSCPQQVSLSAVTGLNFIQMIQDIAAEANFTATFIDIEEKSLIGQSLVA